MKLKELVTKRNVRCQDHEWISTTNSGIRRSICTVCHAVTVQVIDEGTVSLYLSRDDVPARAY
ncbi:MAG TPA: hypothetical protein VLB67_00060 [Acidimicrobiia bacterium]|nr:hypothetical protein [Acidimicrobiia bacterium]